jgi:DNA-binding response OmpR family regulator
MKKRILIIEDEDALREALCTHLTKQGYDVEAVFNTEEGLQRATEHPPDLILLDVITKSLHGAVFLQQLREEANPAKDTPVIVLTNMDDAETLEKVNQYGISGYYVKSHTSLAKVAEAIKALGI